MVSADHDEGGGVDDREDEAEGGEVDDREAEAADDVDDEDIADAVPRPMLQQRFSPFASVITTVHTEGLVIQVNRLLRQRTVAVGFERLVLEPANIVSLRPGLLWTAGALCAIGLLISVIASSGLADVMSGLPGALHGVLPLLSPALLVAGVLALLVAISHPRHVTLFLDREAGMHPSFLRAGPADAEAEAAAFVQIVRRAIIEFRCRPPEPDESSPAPAPRLAAALDALLTMQRDDLLSTPQLAYFRELALRR